MPIINEFMIWWWLEKWFYFHYLISSKVLCFNEDEHAHKLNYAEIDETILNRTFVPSAVHQFIGEFGQREAQFLSQFRV